MSILTQQMLSDRVGAEQLIRLTDDAGTGAVNTTVMQSVIDDGEAELLVNIGQRYTVPLALTDDNTQRAVITRLLDVVEYRLYRRRDVNVADAIAEAYRSAVKWSEAIAEGKLGLPGEVELDSSPAGRQFVIEGTASVVNRESMKGL